MPHHTIAAPPIWSHQVQLAPAPGKAQKAPKIQCGATRDTGTPMTASDRGELGMPGTLGSDQHKDDRHYPHPVVRPRDGRNEEAEQSNCA